jgi:hypothetical protein
VGSPIPSDRSSLVTILGWLVVIGSALAIPISTISFLMILARSYGTSTWDPLGFLTVVVAPPVTLLAGIGLLRRKAWARTYMIVLLAVIIISNVVGMIQSPKEERTYTSPSGVPTTVLATPGIMYVYSAVFVGASAAMLVALLSNKVRSEF